MAFIVYNLVLSVCLGGLSKIYLLEESVRQIHKMIGIKQNSDRSRLIESLERYQNRLLAVLHLCMCVFRRRLHPIRSLAHTLEAAFSSCGMVLTRAAPILISFIVEIPELLDIIASILPLLRAALHNHRLDFENFQYETCIMNIRNKLTDFHEVLFFFYLFSSILVLLFLIGHY